MTKNKKVHWLCIILPIIAVVVAAVTFVTVNDVRVTKTWFVFSEKRIEKLEEIFNADFPDDAEFEYYSDNFRIQGGNDIHTLYIKNIADPESFCRNNFGASVSFTFMADIKNAEVIENEIFSERGAEEFLKWNKESWIKEERSVDFLCRAINQISYYSYDYVEIYFFSNDMGSYDVKLKAEHCGER